MTALWIRLIFSGRAARLTGAVAGLALTVGLLATLGAFVVSSSETMARRATASVSVDWQIQAANGEDVSALIADVGAATAYTAIQPVEYADTAGFAATTGDTTQTTGPGKVLGVDQRYASGFPGQLRLLLGSPDGVLILAQTAANLHVSPGDTVSIVRIGVPPAQVRLSGVVALPNEDATFQAVGQPRGLAPHAPPDNVLIMPTNLWHHIFDPQRQARPDTIVSQLHVRIAREHLPPDPVAAFIHVQRAANSFEARVAGRATVANNLAAQLDAVRADAIYAKVLFLFLGAPGVLLALLMTLAVADTGAERRFREQGLLRLRGASALLVVRLAWVESMVTGGLGLIAGVALALAFARADWQVSDWHPALPWFGGAALLGLIVAVVAFVVPAWRQATTSTVLRSRLGNARSAGPLWQRLYVDVALLALGIGVFLGSGQNGYQLVLAPEGVPQTAIHYETFVAPLCLWIAAGLLWIRLTRLLLNRGQRGVAAMAAPLGHEVAPLIAARWRGSVTGSQGAWRWFRSPSRLRRPRRFSTKPTARSLASTPNSPMVPMSP
ncbi:FtsX-like permease family protein [Paraburkholderia sp. SIMBA_054]|uniref:FtsX-like permease family protein n=1 Tax=Paraburkholderia sp. SIMBA_054 TaxID=3085795 RepID=UPI00397876F3